MFEAKRIREGIDQIKVSAEQGEATAQYQLAYAYCFGEGVEQDTSQSFHWCELAAKQGYVDAQCVLADSYLSGSGIKQDQAQGFYWYKQAADQGSIDAYYQLGRCYFSGLGVEPDFEQAVYWYKKAADGGSIEAAYQLASCYNHGMGVPEDHEAALEWYLKAVAQGYGDALLQCGIIYYEKAFNTGDVQAGQKAFECFMRVVNDDGCEIGVKDYYRDPSPRDYVGLCYKHGIGVAPDEAEAEKWFQPEPGREIKGWYLKEDGGMGFDFNYK